MSNRNWGLVWDTDLDMSRKLLLLAIADQGNDDGINCYPSYETLQRRCSMSRRTLFNALAELEQEGWMERRQIPGTQRVEFRLNVERLLQRSLPIAEQIRRERKCKPCTGANSAPVQSTDETGANSAPHKASKSIHGGVGASAHARVHAREEQIAQLSSHERQVLDPFLDRVPEDLPLKAAAVFLIHRQSIRRPVSIAGWHQLRKEFDAARERGWNLAKSLEAAAAMGYALPADPALLLTNGRGAGNRDGPKRGKARVNDDFSSVSYGQGTSENDIPEFLRTAKN